MTPEAVYHFTATATGEVRDADGRLLDGAGNPVPEGTAQVTGTTEVTIPLAHLASMTDEQLRAHGIDEATVTDIRQKIREADQT